MGEQSPRTQGDKLPNPALPGTQGGGPMCQVCFPAGWHVSDRPRRKGRSRDPPSTTAHRNFKSVEKYDNILITNTAELYQGPESAFLYRKEHVSFLTCLKDFKRRLGFPSMTFARIHLMSLHAIRCPGELLAVTWVRRPGQEAQAPP